MTGDALTEICLRLALSRVPVLSICSQERMAFSTLFFHECTENSETGTRKKNQPRKEGVNMSTF